MDEELQLKNVRVIYSILMPIYCNNNSSIGFQIKEFLQNYNKITDDCFSQCVYTLSHSRLTDEEVDNIQPSYIQIFLVLFIGCIIDCLCIM